MSKAGDIEISVSQTGWPHWCSVTYKGAWMFQVHHSELRDLRYAADKAMREAKTYMRVEHPDSSKNVEEV